MLSTKLLLGLAFGLTVLGVAYAEGFECRKEWCGFAQCTEPKECEGGIVDAGFCGCCKACGKLEGEKCNPGSYYQKNCDTGLKCEEGTCKPAKK